MLRHVWLLLALLLMRPRVLPAEAPIDTDGDGIRDVHERVLGTDPRFPERLQVVLEDGPEPAERRRAGYDPSKDIVKIEFGHVAEDRYFWRATFVAPPHLKDTVFHLYVDADADPATGRKSAESAPHRGTDFMLSVIGGRGRSTQYDAEGHVRPGPPVSVVVEGKSLLVSADINLKRDDRGVRYSLYVLCHTLTSAGPPPMADSTRRRLVVGIPVTNRSKILRLSDYRENHGVIETYGVHRLQRIERDPQNIVIPHDRLETDGFRVDHRTVRRWPHLRREKPDARAWTAAPKSGRFHIGFMMYDDANEERIGIF
ncbi:MAG TPA: hypothetical protein EYP14_13080, partial [Planctomycetaceae bacterium]|nr:hypothetical protein [Planctomycetaceae bacterium]